MASTPSALRPQIENDAPECPCHSAGQHLEGDCAGRYRLRLVVRLLQVGLAVGGLISKHSTASEVGGRAHPAADRERSPGACHRGRGAPACAARRSTPRAAGPGRRSRPGRRLCGVGNCGAAACRARQDAGKAPGTSTSDTPETPSRHRQACAGKGTSRDCLVLPGRREPHPDMRKLERFNAPAPSHRGAGRACPADTAARLAGIPPDLCPDLAHGLRFMAGSLA
jgi:hypothetical protein